MPEPKNSKNNGRKRKTKKRRIMGSGSFRLEKKPYPLLTSETKLTNEDISKFYLITPEDAKEANYVGMAIAYESRKTKESELINPNTAVVAEITHGGSSSFWFQENQDRLREEARPLALHPKDRSWLQKEIIGREIESESLEQPSEEQDSHSNLGHEITTTKS